MYNKKILCLKKAGLLASGSNAHNIKIKNEFLHRAYTTVMQKFKNAMHQSDFSKIYETRGFYFAVCSCQLKAMHVYGCSKIKRIFLTLLPL